MICTDNKIVQTENIIQTCFPRWYALKISIAIPISELLLAITYWSIIVSEKITHISDSTFEQEVLQNDQPVLVDYWAEWCGPCKMIAPILDEIADEYQGKLKITKLNIDDNPATPPKFGIRGIPTLMIFKDGDVAATKVGALSKSQLTAFIDQSI